MIPAYNHFEYGELLAANLKAISHTPENPGFFRATETQSNDELIESFSSVRPGFILVAIDGCNADFGYHNSDNLMEKPQYFFLILKSTDSTASAHIFESQNECRAICKQIIARMMQRGAGYYDSPLQFLDPDSITLRGIGPTGDNWYGCLMGFNMLQGAGIKIDSDFWNI